MTYAETHAADLKEREEQYLMDLQRMHIARALKEDSTNRYYAERGINHDGRSPKA